MRNFFRKSHKKHESTQKTPFGPPFVTFVFFVANLVLVAAVGRARFFVAVIRIWFGQSRARELRNRV